MKDKLVFATLITVLALGLAGLYTVNELDGLQFRVEMAPAERPILKGMTEGERAEVVQLMRNFNARISALEGGGQAPAPNAEPEQMNKKDTPKQEPEPKS